MKPKPNTSRVVGTGIHRPKPQENTDSQQKNVKHNLSNYPSTNFDSLLKDPNFDETQYASDHWDEFLEDPENITDFPENIFDAQLD